MLEVSDTGMGMTTEEMEHVFEPFYSKKNMKRSGSGLGLAVVWGAVRDHSGYIDLQSTEGKGSTFCLYFPASREKEMVKEVLLPQKELQGNGEQILVVDDVKQQCDLARTILTKLGYNVMTLENGEDAVEHLKTSCVDLVVLDMIMDPGIDGLATYQGILKTHPHQKALIASGYSDTEKVKKAVELGVHMYIRKPYTIQSIGAAVKSALTHIRKDDYGSH